MVRTFHLLSFILTLILPPYSDVTDVAWSPEDRFLASVGLDSAVMVWCGFTLGMVMHRSYLSIDN